MDENASHKHLQNNKGIKLVVLNFLPALKRLPLPRKFFEKICMGWR